LSQAGLSSRSFYRHFDSKDALLLALFRRDADAVGASLRAAVDAAADPLDALNAWLDGYLAVFFEPRRAARVRVMTSEGARKATGYEVELARVQRLLIEPLIDVLRRGWTAGALSSADPELDAVSILALVGSVSGGTEISQRAADLATARHQLVRFIWPALGLD